MLINVAFNGKKLFEWEGDADAVARIDAEINRLAKANDVSPEALSYTMLDNITSKGRFLKGGHETQMMILVWTLIGMPTGYPDRPGKCRDYLEAWNFDFDVCHGRNDRAFKINVKGSPAHGSA